LIAARSARLEHEWWRTAAQMAQFYSAHKDKNSPKLGAESFNPFAKPKPVEKRPATDEDLRILFGE
jgi:hypothetical protein